ncbi:MAG: dihydrodipicolinate synthase family protein [Planctomycetes bacterium]|nr:dihydrodipicolinate synthase family protein [Planctomycetota bacterium]
MPSSFAREKLHTVQLVPLTAFDEHAKLALSPMQTLTARLHEAGVRVFIPCAGSAEFHSLDPEEIVAAVRMTRETIGSEGTIIAPIGHWLENAVRLGESSLEAGADAVLVMPLAFPYLSDAGARDYYLAIMERLGCPTLIYKKDAIPGDELLLDLSGHPNLIGVKYAVNDIDAFTRVVQRNGGRIDWYCGSAERFAPFFMLAGAPGYTSGAGNVVPRLTLAMHAAAARGDWPEAMRLLAIIRPIEEYRARAGSSYNISFLKHAIRSIGLDFGRPRPPQRRLSEEEMREIDALMTSLLEAERELEHTPT